ncbi:MAG: AAA family ATPase [Promethearchaeota archaeon]
MKRMFGGGGRNTNGKKRKRTDRSRRRRCTKKKKKEHRVKLLFTINQVIYPDGYQEEYYAIRALLQCSSIQFQEESGVETNAVSYAIRNGTAKLTAHVHCYNSNFQKYDECRIQTKNLFLPFIEPYVLYEAIVEDAPNGGYFDYYVTKIDKIHVLQFKMNTPSIQLLRGLLGRELSIKGSACRRLIGFLREHMTKKRRKDLMKGGKKGKKGKKKVKMIIGGTQSMPITQYDFECAFGIKMFQKMKKESLYFDLKDLMDAIQVYRNILRFKNLLFVKLTHDKIKELRTIIETSPWRFALPSVCKEFFIIELEPQDVKKLESIYKEQESPDLTEDFMIDSSFPPEYYWASYIWSALKKIQEETKDLFTYYSTLYSRIKDIIVKKDRENQFTTVEIDPVYRVIMNEKIDYSKKDWALSFFRDNSKASDGFHLLLTNFSIFMNKRPRQTTNEKNIGKRYDALLKHERDPKKLLYDLNIMQSECDRVYRYTMCNTLFIDGRQRIYVKETWDLQMKALNYLRLLKIRNAVTQETIQAPNETYTNTTQYQRLNKEQKEAVEKGVSKLPIAFCTGAPGTGKTEAIKSIIDAFDEESSYICVCGVNGITAHVLRKRLGPTFVSFSQKKGGEKASTTKKCILSVMTMDMMYALHISGKHPDFDEVLSKAQTLIIDEVQNMDLKRFVKVISILPALTRLRFFGDFDQIGPIAIGKIALSIFRATQSFCKTKLVENNRLRLNPDSKSILHNVQAMTNAPYFDTKYDLINDNADRGDNEWMKRDGTAFINADEYKCVSKIIDLYIAEEEFMTIDMITPLKRTTSRMNYKLGDLLRKLVLKKTNWSEGPQVKFGMAYYTIDGEKQKRNILRPGVKVRFCKNYAAARVQISEKKWIRSDAVNNGEKGWIEKVSILSYKRSLIYYLRVGFRDGTYKKIVVGPKHIDHNHIVEGYFTTIDASLGGENKTIVFYLGNAITSQYTGAVSNKSPVMTNLIWVPRNHMVTAMSRPTKRMIVFGPKVEIRSEQMCSLYEIRERKKGRVLGNQQRDQMGNGELWKMDAKNLIKIMADLRVREQNSDNPAFIHNMWYLCGDIERSDIQLNEKDDDDEEEGEGDGKSESDDDDEEEEEKKRPTKRRKRRKLIPIE